MRFVDLAVAISTVIVSMTGLRVMSISSDTAARGSVGQVEDLIEPERAAACRRQCRLQLQGCREASGEDPERRRGCAERYAECLSECE